jgi:hypothetical protein
MKDKELEILSDWRFCKMDYATKCPRYSNWQNSPFSLQSIPPTGNIGILTGPKSNGILAIDFDGYFAWNFWSNNIQYPISNLKTVTWTSGREARCQMAFNVPEELWPHIKTFKIVSPDKTEGLEFRWDGCQSVLPPSMHPDTKQPYFWVEPPSTTPIQDLPFEILEWMLDYSPIITDRDIILDEVKIENLTLTLLEETESILLIIKQNEPNLSYDDWIRITWATVSHIGTEAGLAVMQSLWPEQSKNEYRRLMKGFSISKSPTFGSLIYRSAKYKTTQRALIKQEFSPNKTIKQFL